MVGTAHSKYLSCISIQSLYMILYTVSTIRRILEDPPNRFLTVSVYQGLHLLPPVSACGVLTVVFCGAGLWCTYSYSMEVGLRRIYLHFPEGQPKLLFLETGLLCILCGAGLRCTSLAYSVPPRILWGAGLRCTASHSLGGRPTVFLLVFSGGPA
jgi:hypothetical protein